MRVKGSGGKVRKDLMDMKTQRITMLQGKVKKMTIENLENANFIRALRQVETTGNLIMKNPAEKAQQ